MPIFRYFALFLRVFRVIKRTKMYERFELLLKQKNLTAYKVCKATGIPTSTIYTWKLGKTSLSMPKLVKIADYLGVTVDYLMGRTDNPNGITVDTKIRELAEQYFPPQPKSKIQSVYDELSEEHQNTLLALAEYLRSLENKTVPNDITR